VIVQEGVARKDGIPLEEAPEGLRVWPFADMARCTNDWSAALKLGEVSMPADVRYGVLLSLIRRSAIVH
jgi:hypothetical protein